MAIGSETSSTVLFDGGGRKKNREKKTNKEIVGRRADLKPRDVPDTGAGRPPPVAGRRRRRWGRRRPSRAGPAPGAGTPRAPRVPCAAGHRRHSTTSTVRPRPSRCSKTGVPK